MAFLVCETFVITAYTFLTRSVTARKTHPVCLPLHTPGPSESCDAAKRRRGEQQDDVASQSSPHSNPSYPTLYACSRRPNIFNYIFCEVVRLSNQGADIDACADKSANTGNEINKDFEERVTANFVQWSAPRSGVMF